IRDRNVTGVQTCALPIYSVGYQNWVYAEVPEEEGGFIRRHRMHLIGGPQRLLGEWFVDQPSHPCVSLASFCVVVRRDDEPRPLRSEERRVGKECRSWWST